MSELKLYDVWIIETSMATVIPTVQQFKAVKIHRDETSNNITGVTVLKRGSKVVTMCDPGGRYMFTNEHAMKKWVTDFLKHKLDVYRGRVRDIEAALSGKDPPIVVVTPHEAGQKLPKPKLK